MATCKAKWGQSPLSCRHSRQQTPAAWLQGAFGAQGQGESLWGSLQSAKADTWLVEAQGGEEMHWGSSAPPHQLQTFPERRQPSLPAGFGHSTAVRGTGVCQHRGVKCPAGCNPFGKQVQPGWCNPLSSATTLPPPTHSHHEALLGQFHMAVSWKRVIRNLLERSWWRNQCREGEGADMELLGSCLSTPWVGGLRIMGCWHRTQLGGHIGAGRMEREQKWPLSQFQSH